MLKRALLVMSLSVMSCVACESLPKVPRHVQYGIYPQVNPPGFYGVDNESRARVYRSFDDARMRGGQCVTAEDYRKWTRWIDRVKQMAESRCR